MTLRYPTTPRGDVVDDYHGTQVADPYRWLEDLGSADTTSWIAAQNAATLPLLEALPQRARLLARLTQLWNYPRTSLPVEEAGYLYYRHNSGLQRQAGLYRRATPDAQPQLLLDPDTLSADGSTSLADWAPSPDGRYVAYALSQGGADFYGLPPHDGTVTLAREPWTVPSEHPYGDFTLVPLRAGEVLRWRLV